MPESGEDYAHRMHGIPTNSPNLAPPGLDPDIRRVLDALRVLVRELRLASVSTEKRHGLSSAQAFVLHTLRGGGPLSLGAIAEATFTDPSSVSVVVRKLEERGLVVKGVSAEDRRRLEIDLSPEGRRVLEQAPLPVQDALIQRLEALGPAEVARLAGLLEALAPPEVEPPPMFFEERGESREKEAGHGRR